MTAIAFKVEYFIDVKMVSECSVEDFVGGICSRCMQVPVHVLSSRDSLFFFKVEKNNNIY